MSGKGSVLMKNAQNEKTRQTVEKFVEWYATKEEFYKIYLPIQQTVVKKIMKAADITFTRLRQFSQIMADQKDLQATIFEKNEKNTLSDETKFQPKTEEIIDPKDPKGAYKLKQQLPVWSNNIDRIMLSLSLQQRQRQKGIKKIYKTLDTIQESLLKQQGKYKTQLKKFDKELENTFNKIDQFEKQQSKTLGKLIKQIKSQQIKDSAFFIGQIKKMQKGIMNQIQLFAYRGKITLDLIQAVLKSEKQVAKKLKEELTAYRNYRQSFLGIDLKGQEEIWGQVSLIQEKIQIQRVSYFNKILLRPERVQSLKKILLHFEPKNCWQAVIKFLQTTKDGFSQIISAQKSIQGLLKNISYRCWPDIFIAQGWLIETYTPSIMYMTYDSIMLIYSIQGQCLKKIHTSESNISKIQGNVVFLKQKIKGFFSDSVEEYKIKFKDQQRLEQYQLFIQNQIS